MEKNIKDELVKAMGNPNGYSGHTSPDGTPLTNYEYWQRINKHD